MKLFILAPGPSANAEIAEKIKNTGTPLMVVTSAFDLAPWAHYIVAADRAFWIKYPNALKAGGEKYCAHILQGTKRIIYSSGTNSGVLALQVAKTLGYTDIYLFGFDMHGTHYFGEYKNGLKNTSEKNRRVHLAQYSQWHRSNKKINVFNCTKDSAIKCFEFMEYGF